MKNFLILLFIFFLIFLLLAFLSPDSLFIFFCIYLALIIAAICLFIYLGNGRGVLFLLVFLILPFLLEYFLSLYKLPFFSNSLIVYLSTKQINLPATTANLIAWLNLPSLMICSLIFSQKLRLLFNIKSLPKTFLVLASSLLLALNFLNFSGQNNFWQPALKWLIIGLIIYAAISKLMDFKAQAPEFFKEMPIILWLLLFALNFITSRNYLVLIIGGAMLVLYLIALLNEHQYRKLGQANLA